MINMSHEPRRDGDSVAANAARWEEHEDVDDEPCKTLQNLLKKHKSVIDIGKQRIDKYVEKNVSTEMHRALAIQAYTAGVTLWGLGIVEAASRAVMSLELQSTLFENGHHSTTCHW